jgi:hypothetical protein
MDTIQELLEIRARVDRLIAEMLNDTGNGPEPGPGSGEIVVPDRLPSYRNDCHPGRA